MWLIVKALRQVYGELCWQKKVTGKEVSTVILQNEFLLSLETYLNKNDNEDNQNTVLLNSAFPIGDKDSRSQCSTDSIYGKAWSHKELSRSCSYKQSTSKLCHNKKREIIKYSLLKSEVSSKPFLALRVWWCHRWSLILGRAISQRERRETLQSIQVKHMAHRSCKKADVVTTCKHKEQAKNHTASIPLDCPCVAPLHIHYIAIHQQHKLP